MARTIVGPDQRRWRIRRRWLPWKPRKRSEWWDFEPGFLDLANLDFLDSPLAFVALLFIAIILGAVLVFLLPFLVTALEVLIVFVLMPLFVVARVAFRTPWIIVADTQGPPQEERVRAVSGWRKSGQAMEELAREIQLGAPAPQQT